MQKRGRLRSAGLGPGLLYLLYLFVSGCATATKPAADEADTSSPAKNNADAFFIADAPVPEFIPQAPEPAPPQARYSLEVENLPLAEFISAVARDAGLDLLIHGAPQGSITLRMQERTLGEILDAVAAQAAVRFRLADRTLRVYEDTPYLQTYRVDYLNIERESGSAVELSTQVDSISLTIDAQGQGVGGSNSSRAHVNNSSHNQFWQTLARNVAGLLGIGDDKAEQRVMSNPEAGVLAVLATDTEHRKVRDYIRTVSERARKQVLIEALIVEVALNDDYRAGVDWRVLSGDSTQTRYLQSTAMTTTAEGSLPGLGSEAGAMLSVVRETADSSLLSTLSLLQRFGDVRILSSPKINALNNQPAVLKVVDNRVYFTVGVQRIESEDTFEKLTTTSEIKTVPVGLVMNVIPHISDDNDILLNIRPTISRIIGYVSDPNPDLAEVDVSNLIPEIQVREMESVLRVRDGGMVVIGGLMQETVSDARQGVPGLSRVPLLGRLFRQDEKNSAKTELLIVLRPVVIDSAARYREGVFEWEK
ncbi:pilus (MSHA type) biogenesis protein MshL [Granulosicoccaceae sp. 1_MG-2023]|nr:pilus (MSHA type) biogenesis protein MshL [Granulosicoccaceae sp. 1_MG-2023]